MHYAYQVHYVPGNYVHDVCFTYFIMGEIGNLREIGHDSRNKIRYFLNPLSYPAMLLKMHGLCLNIPKWAQYVGDPELYVHNDQHNNWHVIEVIGEKKTSECTRDPERVTKWTGNIYWAVLNGRGGWLHVSIKVQCIWLCGSSNLHATAFNIITDMSYKLLWEEKKVTV